MWVRGENGHILANSYDITKKKLNSNWYTLNHVKEISGKVGEIFWIILCNWEGMGGGINT